MYSISTRPNVHTRVGHGAPPTYVDCGVKCPTSATRVTPGSTPSHQPRPQPQPRAQHGAAIEALFDRAPDAEHANAMSRFPWRTARTRTRTATRRRAALERRERPSPNISASNSPRPLTLSTTSQCTGCSDEQQAANVPSVHEPSSRWLMYSTAASQRVKQQIADVKHVRGRSADRVVDRITQPVSGRNRPLSTGAGGNGRATPQASDSERRLALPRTKSNRHR